MRVKKINEFSVSEEKVQTAIRKIRAILLKNPELRQLLMSYLKTDIDKSLA